jgi:hypothetical protein
MTWYPTFTQELLKLPAAHLCQDSGFPDGQSAPTIEGQSQLAPDLALDLLEGELEGVDNVRGNFEHELRHL